MVAETRLCWPEVILLNITSDIQIAGWEVELQPIRDQGTTFSHPGNEQGRCLAKTEGVNSGHGKVDP
jgi:hypothetical protein